MLDRLKSFILYFSPVSWLRRRLLAEDLFVFGMELSASGEFVEAEKTFALARAITKMPKTEAERDDLVHRLNLFLWKHGRSIG